MTADVLSTHTPGPWNVEPAVPGEASGVHVFAANPAGCSEDGDLVTIADFIENDANARLIAAAPDLLKACRVLLAIYDAELGGIGHPGVREARATIAKAEGRS